MEKVDRELLYKELVKGVVTVTFIKANGDTRQMPCSLQPEYLDSLGKSSDEASQTFETNAIAVWALESEGWRSFRWDSVLFYSVQSTLETITIPLVTEESV